MPAPGVDWDLINERLPTAQIPRARELRDKLFADIDRSGNGFLTMSEVGNGLPALLESRGQRMRGSRATYLVPISDFRPAVKCAFAVAHKIAPAEGNRKAKEDHRSCVDRREFHALLLAFKTYIELNVLFEYIDQDENRRLNWKECQKALPLLEEWNISEAQARRRFPDDWKATVDFHAFANWCITRRFGTWELQLDCIDAEETLRDEAGNGAISALLKAFYAWDSDGSGTISAEELADVLMDLDDTFTKEQAMNLFEIADVNNDGEIDYVEFASWVAR